MNMVKNVKKESFLEKKFSSICKFPHTVEEKMHNEGHGSFFTRKR